MGHGSNYFDNDLIYSNKSIYSYGLKWKINKKLDLEAKVTNSFRATPSTGLLTIPSDNKNLYAANFVYYPNGEDKFGLRLNFIF